MDKIRETKRAINLKKWKEEIKAQAASGLSVKEWCIRNNINLKTYYYHLRQVRMFLLEKNASGEAVHEIVPISGISVSDHKQPEIGIANIVIRKAGMEIEIPQNISPQMFQILLQELRSC